MPQDLTEGLVNIGSGNGLVPCGIKPLPELVLTHICVNIVSADDLAPMSPFQVLPFLGIELQQFALYCSQGI